MKITIDTKEDSHDDLRKVIELLSSFLTAPNSTAPANIFEQSTPSVGNLMGMFDSPKEKAEVPELPVKQPSIELY